VLKRLEPGDLLMVTRLPDFQWAAHAIRSTETARGQSFELIPLPHRRIATGYATPLPAALVLNPVPPPRKNAACDLAQILFAQLGTGPRHFIQLVFLQFGK
jgi:hypothetical protein